MSNRFPTFRTLAALACSGMLLAACGAAPMHGPPAQGTPQMGVMVLQSRPLPLSTELPGRTEPVLVADVRPQITGLVQARRFTEGSDVKVGALLYQVDPSVYQVAVHSAQAALDKARSSAEINRIKAARYTELVAIKAVSQQDYEAAVAALQQSQADVAAAEATLEGARIDLAHTRIVAPVSGRIGKSTVTPGALVTANQATALATVQQLDPIYVDLTQSSNEALRLRRALDTGELRATGKAARVRLKLEDGTLYPLEGRLQFSDVTVDTNTGAITLRALIPNPRGELLPGMYVRAIVDTGVQEQALLVPQRAVSRDADGSPTVYVVNADNRLELRRIETTRAVGDQWLVNAGLRAGERLVIDGQQRARPGVAVIVTPFQSAAPLAMASAPAAGPERRNN